MSATEYGFLKAVGSILNSGESRSVLLTGEVQDLFFAAEEPEGGEYLPLTHFLCARWGAIKGKLLLVYELNGPIRFVQPKTRERLEAAWLQWRSGFDKDTRAIKKMLMTRSEQADLEALSATFSANLNKAQESPSVALEFLRQLCLCSRGHGGAQDGLQEDLLILIEGADMLVPEGDIARLSDADRHRVAVLRDWFCDPGFMGGGDSVVLVSESASQINRRVARLPQVLEIRVPAPGQDERRHVIEWFNNGHADAPAEFGGSDEELASLTAGLSSHALLQLLTGAAHRTQPLTAQTIIEKVEAHVQQRLGDDVVEFKKPKHKLDGVVGFSGLKTFLRQELIPRFLADGEQALPGAAVCGPIGGGKTFIFEAVASELDVVVLVLKGIRSKWFGETDLVFERLQRVLNALGKVIIFVDEADTQFGGVDANTHPTERRLTGKIQAMMSDTALRGRLIWLLMTARIELLSPDIRRPGRVGDLIIPVLDPAGGDREAFVRWMIAPVAEFDSLEPAQQQALAVATEHFSAAGFAAMRSELLAKHARAALSLDDVVAIIADHIPPNIADARRYQTLQALLNCTRRSLLPDPNVTEEERRAWSEELRALEALGRR